MTSRFIRYALSLGFVLALGACGESEAPLDVQAEVAAADFHARTPPAPSPTIVDIVVEAATDEENPEFTILLQALESADLVEVLAARGQRTVFAPTDAAFEALLGLLDVSAEDLLGDEDLLEDVLLYHMAPGRRLSGDVLGAEQIHTVEGGFIYPLVTDEGAFLVDESDLTENAELLAPDLIDIEATNGVIHVIDQVLVPGDDDCEHDDYDDDDDCEDDDDDEDDEGEFEGYATLVSLDGEAPERTMSVDVDDDGETVTVDIVEGTTVFKDDGDLKNFGALLEALDAGVMVEIEGKGPMQDDGSVMAYEVKAETDDDDDDQGEETIAAFVERLANDAENPQFTILLAALRAADLVEALDDDDHDFTVFAPTDAAFERVLELLELTADELLADTELLRAVLLYHAVPGKLFSEDVLAYEELKTVQGSPIFPTLTEEGAFILDGSELTDDAQLLAPDLIDIEVENGVIHVIDEVLLF